mmetsp:Transcript_15794/g.24368  ORF Transcript_15794/g.24368 Transcript_15794/m.24368 type:complete len:101 (+) Transcript_15794:120-422(+)
MSDNKRRTSIAIVAILSTLLMLHQLRNQDPTFAHTISETSKSSASQLLNNTAPAWKTAARACERPVILEERWTSRKVERIERLKGGSKTYAMEHIWKLVV